MLSFETTHSEVQTSPATVPTYLTLIYIGLCTVHLPASGTDVRGLLPYWLMNAFVIDSWAVPLSGGVP
jgi:hypothetical protein